MSSAGAPGLERIARISRSRTRPDGTPMPADQAEFEVAGLPADSSLIVDGRDFGTQRVLRSGRLRPGGSVAYNLTIVHRNGAREARAVQPTAGEYLTLRYSTEFPKKVVVTRLRCIRQEGRVFADRPRLVFTSDHGTTGAVQRERMRTGETWPLELEIPTDGKVALKLYDIDAADPIDDLGTIRIDVERRVRTGRFDADPNRVGCLYEVDWRVEPRDTLTETLKAGLEQPAVKKAFLDRLSDDVDVARTREALAGREASQAEGDRKAARGVLADAQAKRDQAQAKRAENERRLAERNDEVKDRTRRKADAESRVLSAEGDFKDAWKDAGFKPISGPRTISDVLKDGQVIWDALSRNKVFTAAPPAPAGAIGPAPVALGLGPLTDVKIPDGGFSDGLKKKRDQAADAIEKKLEAIKGSNPVETLQKIRDHAFDELEVLADDARTLITDVIEKAGNALEKLAAAALKAWHDAIEALKKFEEELKKAWNAIPGALADFAEAVKRELSAESILGAARDVLAAAEQGYEWIKTEASNAVEEVKSFVRLLTDQSVVVYEIRNELTFSLNAYTGAVDAELDLGFSGLKWDLEKTKDLFRGRLSLPSVDPLRALASALGVSIKADNREYVDARERATAKPGVHAFFASERFVDWGGPATAAKLLAMSVVDGGQQATQEAKQQLAMEYNRLYSWVALRTRNGVDAIVADLFAAALSGGRVALPELEVAPLAVPYTYRVDAVGLVPLPKDVLDRVLSWIKGLVPSVSLPAGLKTPLDHFAYAAYWTPRDEARHRDLLDRVESEQFAGKSAAMAGASAAIQGAIARASGDKDLARVLATVAVGDFQNALLDDASLLDLKGRLGITKDDLARYYRPGQSLIRLEGTPIAQRLGGILRGAALGNEGNSRLASLTFDLESFAFSGRVDVTHKHVWGSLSEVFSGVI